jgi:hypothetical protein
MIVTESSSGSAKRSHTTSTNYASAKEKITQETMQGGLNDTMNLGKDPKKELVVSTKPAPATLTTPPPTASSRVNDGISCDNNGCIILFFHIPKTGKLWKKWSSLLLFFPPSN